MCGFVLDINAGQPSGHLVRVASMSTLRGEYFSMGIKHYGIVSTAWETGPTGTDSLMGIGHGLDHES